MVTVKKERGENNELLERQNISIFLGQVRKNRRTGNFSDVSAVRTSARILLCEKFDLFPADSARIDL